MRWDLEETEKVINLLKNGNDFETIAKLLNRSKKAIKEKLNKLGYKQSDYVVKKCHEDKKCECCGITFNSLISDNRKYCSQSCSVTITNTLRKKTKNCLECGNIIIGKNKIYCNHKCNKDYNLKLIFKSIENGDTTIKSRMIKKYLIHIHGEKCMECGWCSINPTSNKVPIELEHIDGNSENNSLDNLKLLCPNCHSLTSTYKALNKGNGRHNRMIRYNNGKSY
jgi:hypothetical protein